MLAGFIQLIHILVCIGLIVIVLLQADKGEGLAGAFGGGSSSTVFGERGSGGFMSKLTTTMAVIFMITSLIIAVFVPRWEEAAPKQEITTSMPMAAPMAVPGLPIDVPAAAPVAPVAATAEPVAAPVAAPVTAPVAPAAAVAEPVAAPVTAPAAAVAEPAAVPAPAVSAPVAPAVPAEVPATPGN